MFEHACSATTTDTDNDKACKWVVYNEVLDKTLEYNAVLDKTLQVCVAKKERICFNGETEKCLSWPDDFLKTTSD